MNKRDPIHALIVDDEPEAQDILENLVREIQGIQIAGKASSVEEAFTLYLERTPDVIFLDIDMPRRNGFHLVEMIRDSGSECAIIFTTAYNEYAIQAIKVAALDYLLKPIDRSELALAIEKLRQVRNANAMTQKLDRLLDEVSGKSRIRINTRTGIMLVDPEKLFYCKADGNYSVIHLTDGATITCSMHLGKLEESMPDGMLRINRNILVNASLISRLDRKQRKLWLESDGVEMELPIASRRLGKVLEAI